MMGKITIPEQIVWRCDACGYEDDDHKKDGKPKHWSELVLKRDAYDFQGNAAADATIYRFLCQPCTNMVVDKLNELKKGLGE